MLTTEEFAKNNFVKPQSVRSRYCQTGSYYGLIPEKLPNGRLIWPSAENNTDHAGNSIPSTDIEIHTEYSDEIHNLRLIEKAKMKEIAFLLKTELPKTSPEALLTNGGLEGATFLDYLKQELVSIDNPSDEVNTVMDRLLTICEEADS